MTTLAEVLAGRRPGVQRWAADLTDADLSDADLSDADLRTTVAAAGWALALLDGHAHPGTPGLLTQVAQQLAFPAWFGHNYDALADCLADLPGPTLLVWDGWASFAREDPAGFDLALDVLTERAARAPAFVVLLRGEGPDLS